MFWKRLQTFHALRNMVSKEKKDRQRIKPYIPEIRTKVVCLMFFNYVSEFMCLSWMISWIMFIWAFLLLVPFLGFIQECFSCGACDKTKESDQFDVEFSGYNETDCIAACSNIKSCIFAFYSAKEGCHLSRTCDSTDQSKGYRFKKIGKLKRKYNECHLFLYFEFLLSMSIF